MSIPVSSLLGPWWPAGNKNDSPASGVCADSREVTQGSLFFAIKGQHTDAHELIPGLLGRKPSCIVIERDIPPDWMDAASKAGIPVVQVPHARTVLSHAAAAWYGFPAKKLQVLGVTGTDGKSSTVFFAWQLLRALGIKAGFFSTVSMSLGDEAFPNSLRQSTPEPLELHGILSQMVAHGVTHVVMESTSHGLSPRTARLADLDFLGAVFTNLSHEHLEFHGTYEQYRDDKANLFRRAKGFSVINRADAQSPYMAEVSATVPDSYELEGMIPGDRKVTLPAPLLKADRIVDAPDSLSFRLSSREGESWPVTLPFPGVFNAENVMAAVIAVHRCTGTSLGAIVPFLKELRGVKGRMVPVRNGQDFTVIVDYAHTPGSYERLLPMFRSACRGRLIAVFGSAGERDVRKRPMQGAIASRHCNVLVLCNEDPRLEDPMDIIDQIAEGALNETPAIEIHRIPDRKLAMETAFRMARKDDTVLLLGKGHEQSIVLADGKIPWDDEDVARELLGEFMRESQRKAP